MNETIRAARRALLDARAMTPAPPTKARSARMPACGDARADGRQHDAATRSSEIEDQALQGPAGRDLRPPPFIARAPWVLLFVADFQKWMDLFAACGCDELPGVPRGVTPGPGDLLMACNDALIAAQNAVVAAESLGIGSCYIGDIMELGETHAELLRLPPYTFPAALLCLGRPKVRRVGPSGTSDHVVHKNVYRRLTPSELGEASRELDAIHGARGSRPGISGCVQDVYARKFTADFAAEMNRSVAWWLARWYSGESAAAE